MTWMDILVKVVFLVITGIATMYVLPWLKEKGLYDTVCRMVQGAEKWSKNHEIDKKAWAVAKLEARGIEVNEYVEALIESACEELDLAWAKAVNAAKENEQESDA